jgi:hypothetical protein
MQPERNIRIAFGRSSTCPYRNEPGAFTEQFIESPSVVKTGNKWLIYFDVYKKKEYHAVSTTDFITSKNINAKISISQGHKHCTIIKIPEKILKYLL